MPEHIYLRGKDVLAFSSLDAHPKYRLLDAANDIAVLLNDLNLRGASDMADLFLKRYVSASHDREVDKILPIYEAFQAMRSGLMYSEQLVEGDTSAAAMETLSGKAQAYFNLAVQRVREMPREL